MYFNARSIKNKLSELHSAMYGSDASVIVITESWLHSDMNSDGLVDPYGKFTIFRKDRVGRNGGGVCILVRNEISATLLECVAVPCNDYEIVGCILHAEGHLTLKSDILVISAYIPPDVVPDSYAKAMEHIRSLWNNDCNGIIVGDFNLPTIDWENACPRFKGLKEQALHAMYTDLGCSQYVDKPTRGENILDLLFCNDPMLISDVDITPPFSNSDHATIMFTVYLFDFNIAKNEDSTSEPGLEWDKANWSALRTFFSTINWSNEFSSCSNSNELCSALYIKLYQGINLYVPIRKRRDSQAKFTYHVSTVVKDHQAEKLKSWQVLKAQGSSENFIRYKKSAAAIKLAHFNEDVEREQAIISSNNLGQFYKHINSRLSHRSGVAPLKSPDGTFAFVDAEKAELLNSTFTASRTVDSGVLPVINTNVTARIDSVLFEPDIIFTKLTNLKTGSAPGPDGIPASFLKNLASVLALPLFIFFNCIQNTGIIPDCWKLANVTPIFKKGPSANPENYRPISLTNILCKTFESVIKDQLIEFLDKHRIITRAQHGFLAAHSTTTNLLESINDWTKNLDEGSDTDVAYIDFTKAFDSVSVPKLIHKLASFGLCNPLLSCIKSFLEERSQRVIVGKSVSSYAPVVSGVPQGSVLGPILFILYINDVPCISSEGGTKLFADDVKCYSRSNKSENFQAELDKIYGWSLEWQLAFAPSKCFHLHIRRSNARNSIHDVSTYYLGGQTVPSVMETKDLGILVDDQLTFGNHIRGVVGKAKQRIYLLFKCFKSRNVQLLMKAYITYILPIFDYGSPVWSPCKLGDIDLLENVQRNFTKRLQGMHDLPYEVRLVKCGLVSLELRRLRKDLALCYQIVNGLIALDFNSFFTADPNYRTRGNRQKLKIPKLSPASARSNFFCVRIVPVWNALPDDIILCGSYHLFCKKIECFDFSSYLNRQWDD